MTDFVRVRDKSTRHEFDVPAAHPQIGKALEPIKNKRWPDLSGPNARPRPERFHTDLAGEPNPSPAGTPTPDALKKKDA